MKILQVIAYFSPKFGGDINVCSNLSKELAKGNHEVTIITSDFGFDSQYANTIRDAGVEVIPFHCIAHYGLFLYTPSIKKWLQKNLKEFDIIHLHNYRSFQNIVVRSYAIKYGIPYIMQAHGSVLRIVEKQFLKNAFDLVWGYKILQNASKCIALTKTESDQYVRMGVPEDRIVIIPNGLDLSQFSNLPEKGTFRLKYGIPDNEPVILYLGRIHKIKGIDLLIEAYSLILRELPHARLVIAGPDDGDLSQIQERIQRLKIGRKPLITGLLFGREKLAAYVDADVYVLPSIYEAFSNTVLEAWACGTPVIVTDSCAISPVVQHAGLVVKRNPTELATAIKELLTNESLRREYSKNGKLLVNSEFNIESMITKIERCYRQIVQANVEYRENENLYY